MPDLVDELLARDDVSAGEPPDAAEIEAVISRMTSPIPPPLLKLWRSAKGVQLESIDAELIGLEAALEMEPVLGPEELGFLPVLDTHQSNYVGVMVREALNQAAREAGLKASERSGTALQVVQSWCDLDTFFYKRNRPDALRQIVAWFKNKDESIFKD